MPSQDVLAQKQKPIGKLLEEIAELKESKRNTPQFNHLSAIAEGINAIGWINIVRSSLFDNGVYAMFSHQLPLLM
jgi:hypothetical protein